MAGAEEVASHPPASPSAWRRVTLALQGAGCSRDAALVALHPGALLWAKEAGFPWWPARLLAHRPAGRLHLLWLGWEGAARSTLPASAVRYFDDHREEWAKRPGGLPKAKHVPTRWRSALDEALALQAAAVHGSVPLEMLDFDEVYSSSSEESDKGRETGEDDDGSEQPSSDDDECVMMESAASHQDEDCTEGEDRTNDGEDRTNDGEDRTNGGGELPKGWIMEERCTAKGRVYKVYLHEDGKRVYSMRKLWEHEHELEGARDATDQQAEQGATLPSDYNDSGNERAGGHIVEGTAPSPRGMLPPGWTKALTKGGNPYYHGPSGERTQSAVAAWRLVEQREEEAAANVAEYDGGEALVRELGALAEALISHFALARVPLPEDGVWRPPAKDGVWREVPPQFEGWKVMRWWVRGKAMKMFISAEGWRLRSVEKAAAYFGLVEAPRGLPIADPTGASGFADDRLEAAIATVRQEQSLSQRRIMLRLSGCVAALLPAKLKKKVARQLIEPRNEKPLCNPDGAAIVEHGFSECKALLPPALCEKLAAMPMTSAEAISNAYQKSVRGPLLKAAVSAIEGSTTVREAVESVFGTSRFMVTNVKVLMSELDQAPQIPHADDYCNRELFGIAHLLPQQPRTEAVQYDASAPYPSGVQAQCAACGAWCELPDRIARRREHLDRPGGAPFTCVVAGLCCADAEPFSRTLRASRSRADASPAPLESGGTGALLSCETPNTPGPCDMAAGWSAPPSPPRDSFSPKLHLSTHSSSRAILSPAAGVRHSTPASHGHGSIAYGPHSTEHACGHYGARTACCEPHPPEALTGGTRGATSPTRFFNGGVLHSAHLPFPCAPVLQSPINPNGQSWDAQDMCGQARGRHSPGSPWQGPMRASVFPPLQSTEPRLAQPVASGQPQRSRVSSVSDVDECLQLSAHDRGYDTTDWHGQPQAAFASRTQATNSKPTQRRMPGKRRRVISSYHTAPSGPCKLSMGQSHAYACEDLNSDAVRQIQGPAHAPSIAPFRTAPAQARASVDVAVRGLREEFASSTSDADSHLLVGQCTLNETKEQVRTDASSSLPEPAEATLVEALMPPQLGRLDSPEGDFPSTPDGDERSQPNIGGNHECSDIGAVFEEGKTTSPPLGSLPKEGAWAVTGKIKREAAVDVCVEKVSARQARCLPSFGGLTNAIRSTDPKEAFAGRPREHVELKYVLKGVRNSSSSGAGWVSASAGAPSPPMSDACTASPRSFDGSDCDDDNYGHHLGDGKEAFEPEDWLINRQRSRAKYDGGEDSHRRADLARLSAEASEDSFARDLVAAFGQLLWRPDEVVREMRPCGQPPDVGDGIVCLPTLVHRGPGGNEEKLQERKVLFFSVKPIYPGFHWGDGDVGEYDAEAQIHAGWLLWRTSHVIREPEEVLRAYERVGYSLLNFGHGEKLKYPGKVNKSPKKRKRTKDASISGMKAENSGVDTSKDETPLRPSALELGVLPHASVITEKSLGAVVKG